MLLTTLLMLGSCAFNLGACWVLIFGIEDIIPALGLKGAALAKCLSMGLLCCIFFSIFLSRKNREIYGTGLWRISISALWSYIKPGAVRAFTYFWITASWVLISYILLKKEGVFLAVQTIGGTIIAFLKFIFVGVHRSILIMASNLLGNKNYSELWRLCRSLLVYVCMIGGILAIPFLLFPQTFIRFFDVSSQDIYETTFNMINHWVWLYLVLMALQMGLCGFIVALQELKVQLYVALLSCVTSLLPVYLAFEIWEVGADKLWLIMALENGIVSLIFWGYLYQRKWERSSIKPQSKPI